MRVLIGFLCLLVSGCSTNGFSQFYTDETGGVDLTTLEDVIISDSEPKIYSGNDWETDAAAMRQKGYMLVGWSSYNGPRGTADQVRAQARRVHADTAIFYSQYTDTQSGVVPLTLPDTQVSTTNVYGNVYGPGGTSTVTGTGTTTTTGTKTTYIPYSTRRYDFSATYWVAMKPMIFGAYFEDLSPQQRRQIGSNKGSIITVVVDGSPAFMADFFPGDIIKSINETEIINFQSVVDAITENKGHSIRIELIRDGELLTKTVNLN